MRATGNASLWVDTGPAAPELPQLDRDVDADVAVIGGGIVGITTALLLKEAGARVVLLEADRLGLGVTRPHDGQGLLAARVDLRRGCASRFGADGAATYGAANEAALRWMADRVERTGSTATSAAGPPTPT